MLPNFLICGAAKCGTTALWVWLEEHPEILMASIKEPRFFTEHGCKADVFHPSGNNAPGQYDKGLDWYRSLFNDDALIKDSYKPAYDAAKQDKKTSAQVGERSEIKAAGEATTLYFTAEDSAGLICENLPDAKIIFMLRNPVERVLSHYWHDRRYGWDLPDFSEMIRRDSPVRNRYFLHSNYQANLSRYLERFDKQAIRICIYEEFFENPEASLPALYEFIGVDSSFLPSSINARFNVASSARFSFLQRVLMGRLAARLAKIVPPKIKTPLANLRQRLVRLNSKPSCYSELTKDDRQYLNQHFQNDVEFVEAYLGRKIKSWNIEA